MIEIKNFPGYFITEEGHVWSANKKIFLKEYLTYNGYLRVNLYKDGKRYSKRLHRIVAETFIPNPNNLSQVNHKDENKTNNCVNNLEWCDSKYNNNYGTKTERLKISMGKKIKCIETNIIYNSACEAERETGISNGNINQACHGKRNHAGGYHWCFV